MKFSRLLLVATAVLAPAAISASTTCKRLTDTDSTFVSSLANFLPISDADTGTNVLATIDSHFPWLSKCVAAMNPLAVATATMLSSGFTTCNKTISSFNMPENLTDATLRSTLCPFYGTTVMPCINNVLVQTIVDAMASTGSCCDDMKAQIKTNFGTDLKTMAAELLSRVGSVVCSVKTFPDPVTPSKTTTQSCGEAFLQSFMSETSMVNMIPMMQTPTDQVCKAMTGKPFTTTTGSPAQFTWAALNQPVFGICYEPLSALFKTLASYPMMTTMNTTINGTTVAMADMFATGKCLKTSSIIAWLTDKDSLSMKIARVMDDIMHSMAPMGSMGGSPGWPGSMGSSGSSGSMAMSITAPSMNITSIVSMTLLEYQSFLPISCVHLASGQSCDYSGATIAVAFSVETPTATPVAVETKSPAATTWSVSVAAVSMVLAVSLSTL